MRITSTLAVLTGIALGLSGVETPATAAPDPFQRGAAIVVAMKVPAGRIKVVLRGNRLGKRARVQVRGLTGPAKGTSRKVKVKKSRTVKRLPVGRYRVSGRRISAKGLTVEAKPVRVRLTKRHGAIARLLYKNVHQSDLVDLVAPGQVSGLTVTGRSVTSISLAWANPTDPDLVAVIIRRAPGPVAPATVADGAEVALTAPTANRLTDTGLTAVTVYSYSVFTRDMAGNTAAPVTLTSSTMGAIAAGDAHTCAITAGGTVKCWGSNDDGQLGDDTKTDRTAPVPVKGLTGVIALVAGEVHTCALVSDGRIACWGGNFTGQLGDGTNTIRYVPVTVPGISTAIGIAAGGEQTCALLRGGSVRCWGWNGTGQLGDGTTTTRYAPVPVVGIENAVAVSTGWFHSCALLATGEVRCWGDNSSGQIGDGTTSAPRLTATGVVGITNATAITVGANHTCALLDDSTGVCWGSNAVGQIGDGTRDTSDRPTRVAVAGLSEGVAIDAGWMYTCAVLGDGSARCWGTNGLGQLGDGTDSTRYLPTLVPSLDRVVGIAAGYCHTCARTADNAVSCWGWNDQGQLGDGTTAPRNAPGPVLGL